MGIEALVIGASGIILVTWLLLFFRAKRTRRPARGGRTVSRNWSELADRSDARARSLGIDPPRPGRKTYAQRFAETSAMSDSEIDARIAEREAAGKECGVLYRVKADRRR